MRQQIYFPYFVVFTRIASHKTQKLLCDPSPTRLTHSFCQCRCRRRHRIAATCRTRCGAVRVNDRNGIQTHLVPFIILCWLLAAGVACAKRNWNFAGEKYEAHSETTDAKPFYTHCQCALGVRARCVRVFRFSIGPPLPHFELQNGEMANCTQPHCVRTLSGITHSGQIGIED